MSANPRTAKPPPADGPASGDRLPAGGTESGTHARVLLVTPQPFYEDRGTPIAIRLLLEVLSESGYAIDVLAFPMGRNIRLPGLRILRPRNPLPLTRVPIGFSWRKVWLDLFLFPAIRRQLSREKYDCVHAVEEAAYMAAPLCARAGVPFIYDMASSIPEQLAHHRLFSNHLAQGVAKWIERASVRRSAHVLCSDGLATHVQRIAPASPLTVWQFPVDSHIATRAEAEALRNELGIDTDATIGLYAGSMARYQGVDVLIESVPKLHRLGFNVTLVCVGATAQEQSKLGNAIADEHRSFIRIVPREPRTRIPAYLALADLVISPRAYGKNAPLKLFEYMASGKPVLASRISAHEPFIQAGVVIPFEPSADGLVEALHTVLHNPAHAAATGNSARHRQLALARFGRSNYADLVRSVYARVISAQNA